MKYRLKIKSFIKNEQCRSILSKISDIGGVLSLLILIFGLLPLSVKVDNIAEKVSQNDAKETLMTFFSLVESDDLSGAYNLFSQTKKYKNPYPGFEFWLKDFVGFEGLKITSLPEKDTAIKKVFLVEYIFKKRGMRGVETKQGFYLKFNNGKWLIDYSTTPLYENGRKKGACDFYAFEHCK